MLINSSLFRGAVLATSSAALMSLAVGCSTPDTEARFDEFAERSAERRDNEVNNTPDGGQRVDFSGVYLVGVETILGRGQEPILLQADAIVADDLATIDFVFQPIRTDFLMGGEPRNDARTAVGDSIVVEDVPFGEDGTFQVDLGDISVDGDANPISGGAIEANLILNGIVLGTTAFCGTVEGSVTAPVSAPTLTGSTFGAVAATDIAAAVVEPRCGEDVPNNDPNNNPNNAPNNEPMIPEGRCTPDVLAGTYDLFFITDTQRGQGADATNIELQLEANADEALCYTGKIVSKTDGSDLGTVPYVLLIDGQMVVHVEGFVIPPGANPLLPDGGTANIDMAATNWNENGFCGTGSMTFSLVEPFALDSAGDWSAIKTDAGDGLTIDGPGCEGIQRAEPCGFEDVAGRYDFQFETSSGASQFFMNIEANALTCLGGNYESAINEGDFIANIVSAEGAEGEQLQFNVSNFVIPPGANPLLPDGGAADITMTSQMLGDGFFCGDIVISLFSPFALDSEGTFAAGTVGGNEPAGPACP